MAPPLDPTSDATSTDSRARQLQAHKLELVGQLATGVAHELNTPLQYVSDNVAYLATACDALRELLATTLALVDTSGPASVDAVDAVRRAAGAVDAHELLTELPRAVAEAGEGLARMQSIVTALRGFAHPSRGVREPCDLNQTLQMTITVARNEWRQVAELRAALDPALPPVVAVRDALGQVFLNLLVNAAHAIADVSDGGRRGLGVIEVATGVAGDHVEVRIADSGGGIPAGIAARVFEPFFTTKSPGRGTGQGLALARAVVVDDHGGDLWFEPRPGGGTVFVIALPLGRAGGRP